MKASWWKLLNFLENEMGYTNPNSVYFQTLGVAENSCSGNFPAHQLIPGVLDLKIISDDMHIRDFVELLGIRDRVSLDAVKCSDLVRLFNDGRAVATCVLDECDDYLFFRTLDGMIKAAEESDYVIPFNHELSATNVCLFTFNYFSRTHFRLPYKK